MTQKNNTCIESTLLHNFNTVHHGTSTKNTGFSTKDLDAIVFPRQEHGNRIIWVDESNKHRHVYADGLLTRSGGISIGIRTADCVPVLLYEPAVKIAGVVHAGWRGTVKRIVQHAVAEIVQAGGDVRNIVASIGPHINPCCYTVGDDVASLFWAMNETFVTVIDGTARVCLGNAVTAQLVESGMLSSNIETSVRCTCCEKDMFVSYRRDGPQKLTNQIVSFIQINK